MPCRSVIRCSNRFPTMTLRPMRSSPLAILRACGRSRPMASPFVKARLTRIRPAHAGPRQRDDTRYRRAHHVDDPPTASATRDAAAGDHRGLSCPAPLDAGRYNVGDHRPPVVASPLKWLSWHSRAMASADTPAAATKSMAARAQGALAFQASTSCREMKRLLARLLTIAHHARDDVASLPATNSCGVA